MELTVLKWPKENAFSKSQCKPETLALLEATDIQPIYWFCFLLLRRTAYVNTQLWLSVVVLDMTD